METVSVPSGLTERQIQVAKNWVQYQREIGGTVNAFIQTQRPFSSATWAAWNKETAFTNYVLDLTGEVVTTDEIEAYNSVKSKIIELATAKDAGIREIELFTTHFKGLVEYQNRKDMVKMGIQQDDTADTRTVEERKNVLLNMRRK